ncbi:hypothetical protein Trydic_g20848 [Trypoxylus dichotomus]
MISVRGTPDPRVSDTNLMRRPPAVLQMPQTSGVAPAQPLIRSLVLSQIPFEYQFGRQANKGCWQNLMAQRS